MELEPGSYLEGDGLAVVAHLVALGNASDQLGEILGLEHHQAVIDVGDDLTAGELEDLGRVQGNDVAEVLRHDEGVLGCFGLHRRQATERGGHQGQQESFKSGFHWVLLTSVIVRWFHPNGPGLSRCVDYTRIDAPTTPFF